MPSPDSWHAPDRSVSSNSAAIRERSSIGLPAAADMHARQMPCDIGEFSPPRFSSAAHHAHLAEGLVGSLTIGKTYRFLLKAKFFDAKQRLSVESVIG